MEKQVIPEDVKAAMWQFFLKTSVPRLLPKKRAEFEEQQKQNEANKEKE